MQPKIFGRRAKGKALEFIRKSPNYKVSKFINPIPTSLSINPVKVINDYWQRKSGHHKPHKEIPVEFLTHEHFKRQVSDRLLVRWLGHASSLIEINGLRILTDPVFSKRVSPFPFVGPCRLHPCPIQRHIIPDVDIIIISHNHYDHLDYELISALRDKSIQFVMPLGVGSYLKHWGVPDGNIVELDWHENYSVNDLLITATPARHFTGRGIFDRNKSFWASFVIQNKNERVFFCGDSGFFPGFKKIGDQYGPFDITMIGIGAYNRQWQSIHTNPEEALEAHQLLNGKYLLPIHWCTFDLAPHSWSEPIEWLLRAAEKSKIDLLVPTIGSSVYPSNEPLNYWWR